MKSKSPMHFQFSDTGKFRILALGDSHEKYHVDGRTEDMYNLLNEAAERLNPDLVIYMGDLASRYNDTEGDRLATEEEVMEQIERLTAPFVRRGIPFGITFGNHDNEPPEHKELQFKLFSKIPGFVNVDEAGVTGVGNCFVPIYDHKGEKMCFNLWLIDSGSNAEDGSGYAWVEQDQMDWYESTCDELTKENGGEVVPALSFQHIPVCEEYDLLKKTSILNPFRVRGMAMHKGSWYTRGENLRGYLGEGPAVPAKNSGQFQSWKKKGDVIAAFFGHDHMNDFQGEVENILLCQTKCTGFNIYGDGLHQGVRVIDLDETRPGDLDTYMVYYRDFFGTKANSIKGYDLLTDRWHTNFKITLAVLGSAAGVAGIGLATKALMKKCKKKD